MYFLIRHDSRDSSPIVQTSTETREEIMIAFKSMIAMEKATMRCHFSRTATHRAQGTLAHEFTYRPLNSNSYTIDYYIKRADSIDSLSMEHPYA